MYYYLFNKSFLSIFLNIGFVFGCSNNVISLKLVKYFIEIF